MADDEKQPDDAPKRILLVDDDEEIVQSLKMALESRGYSILIARDGNQGLAMAEREDPDLIILDMMMPKRSGFLVLEKLRRSRPVPLRVIMITANEGSRHKAYAEMLGVRLSLGAGTYADNATCGVSCTGTGEYFIRHVIAYRISALMEFKELTLEEATRHVLEDVLPDDIGGVIAVDRNGAISMRHNTTGMSCGAADSQGKFEIKLGK